MSAETGGHMLVRLGIRVRREQAELALAALLPVLQHGAEETEPDRGVVEYALYAPREELPSEETIRSLVGDALVGLALTDVPEGWERRWHEHLKPVEIASGGRRLRVRPPWEPAGGEQDVLEIVLDPGALFGAGTHATTQLCLELLLELEPVGGLCDWGAGSGILAIAAARLGFAPVDAVELAAAGPDAIRRNAAANGVALNAVRADLTATPAPWAPTVTANLTLDVLQAIAAGPLTQPTSSASRRERPPERLIASGVLAERAGEVAEAFARHGLVEAERRVQADWAAVLLTQRTSSAGTGEAR
jgi:ribosomal protein L11 methyltransferase